MRTPTVTKVGVESRPVVLVLPATEAERQAPMSETGALASTAGERASYETVSVVLVSAPRKVVNDSYSAIGIALKNW